MSFPIAPTAKDSHQQLFNIVRWGNDATNRFFHIIYGGQLWLSQAEALEAARHGYNMCDFCLHLFLAIWGAGWKATLGKTNNSNPSTTSIS